MKLNNLDDFTKNNWYITTTASTIIDTSNSRQQLKEPPPSPPAPVIHQSVVTAEQIQLQHLQVNNNQIPIDIEIKNIDSSGDFNSSSSSSDIIKLTYQINSCENNKYHNNIIMPATTTATTTTDICTTTTLTNNHQSSDVLAVEELVYEIKENLRLKARPKSQNGRSSRPSPYHIPCRSWNDQQLQQNNHQSIINNSNSNNTENHLNCNYLNNNKNTLHYHHHHHHKKEQDIDDPYELLQTLLKSKNLVKEAVRRLQLNNISPKQKSYFYDSDDDQSSRSPMFRMCQLEL